MKELFNDPAPLLPTHLIIEVNSLDPFRQYLAEQDQIGIDEDVAIADILDAIHHDHDAELQLSASGHDMCYENSGQGRVDPFVSGYVKVRHQLGLNILAQCRMLKVFERGLLFYQLERIWEDALILQKLQVPLTDDLKRLRSIARQIDIADKYELPRRHRSYPGL